MRYGRIGLTIAALAAVAGAGCGTADDEDAVRAVTERFYTAVRQDDGERACELLSIDVVEQLEGQSGRSCDDVVTRLDYEGGRVVAAVVYVTNAKVDLSAGESAFLSLEPGGWRLSAVACRAQRGKPRDRPLDCEVQA